MTYFQAIEQESPCREEYPDQSTVLKCHLSSIDLHKQFILEQTFPHILSIVVEIGPKGKKKYEFCQLSEKGTQKVIACNQEECKQDQNVNRLSVPHKACSYPRFTEFVKNQIIFNNNTFKVIDNSNPDEKLQEDTNNSDAGPSNFANGKETPIQNNLGDSKETIASNRNTSKPDKSSNIADSEDNLIECRGCKKKVSSIRLHLRKKSCKQQYSEKEYSEFVKANAAKKSVYLKQYKQNNKDALKKKLQQKRQANEKSFKEAEKKRQRQWRAKNKEALEKKRQDNAKAIKESEKARQSQWRAKNKEALKKKRQDNAKAINESEKAKLSQWRAKNKEALKKKKRQDNAKAIKESEKARQSESRSKKRKRVTCQGRVLAFKRDIIDGPNFVCFSCNRCLFKSSVRILKENDISKLIAKVGADLFIEAGLEACINNTELIVCYGCFNSLSKNKFPSLNVNNGLKVEQVPDDLSCISDLEQQLIARSLIFMKMKKLPTSRMGAVVDQVISVPIEQTDVVKNVSKLPRHPSDAQIVAVKLKRKLEYKTAVLEEFIRPKTVIRALEILKECGNEYYQHINVDKDFMVTNTETEKKDSDEDENVDIEVDNQSIISEESEDESED